MAERKIHQAKYRAGLAVDHVKAGRCEAALEDFRIASELVGEAIDDNPPSLMSAMQATARAQDAIRNGCLRSGSRKTFGRRTKKGRR
jgi:hypothetical protein